MGLANVEMGALRVLAVDPPERREGEVVSPTLAADLELRFQRERVLERIELFWELRFVWEPPHLPVEGAPELDLLGGGGRGHREEDRE